MFCEIAIGQLLGPNPGRGSNYSPEEKGFAQNPHADTGLPPQRVEDFRRYYGWRDALVEAVRSAAALLFPPAGSLTVDGKSLTIVAAELSPAPCSARRCGERRAACWRARV
jgi:hypothetical protein